MVKSDTARFRHYPPAAAHSHRRSSAKTYRNPKNRLSFATRDSDQIIDGRWNASGPAIRYRSVGTFASPRPIRIHPPVGLSAAFGGRFFPSGFRATRQSRCRSWKSGSPFTVVNRAHPISLIFVASIGARSLRLAGSGKRYPLPISRPEIRSRRTMHRAARREARRLCL